MVFQVVEYGEVVSSVPRFVPSSLNWTPATPMLSDAVADTVMVPETVVPAVGADSETEGGVVSGVVVAVTVTLWVTVPPLPVQLNVYVPVAVMFVTVCVPDVVLVPVHPPLAVQEVAFVLDQVRVDELPDVTEVGEADRVRVDAGVGSGAVLNSC